jgi:hypothetical protein
MNTYLVKPKYEQNVSERTMYSNDEGKYFVIERYYRTVDIIVKSDKQPIINIDCVFGENMVEYIKDKCQSNCQVEYSVFQRTGVEYPADMPSDLRDKFRENPDYDLTKDGWNVVETELWGYTLFYVFVLAA